MVAEYMMPNAMFAQRFKRGFNTRERKIIRLGIAMYIEMPIKNT